MMTYIYIYYIIYLYYILYIYIFIMFSTYSRVSMTLIVSRRIIKIKVQLNDHQKGPPKFGNWTKSWDPNTQRPTLTSILKKVVDTLPGSSQQTTNITKVWSMEGWKVFTLFSNGSRKWWLILTKHVPLQWGQNFQMSAGFRIQPPIASYSCLMNGGTQKSDTNCAVRQSNTTGAWGAFF